MANRAISNKPYGIGSDGTAVNNTQVSVFHHRLQSHGTDALKNRLFGSSGRGKRLVNFDGNRLLEFDTDKIGEGAASIDAQNYWTGQTRVTTYIGLNAGL